MEGEEGVMEAPRLLELREAVDSIRSYRDQMLCKVLYLTAARVSEALTKVGRYDREHKATKPLGAFADWSFQQHDGEKALVLKLPILKRKVKSKKNKSGSDLVYRMVALPLQYEPWVLDVLKFLRKEGKLGFDFTRQTAWRIVRENLRELDGDVHPHSLRHYRCSHLVLNYDFQPFDLVTYVGWSMRSGLGQMGLPSPNFDYYLHLGWKSYFKKLCIPLSEVS